MFTLFDIKEIIETTLGANQLLSELPEKLTWNTSNRKNDDKSEIHTTDSLELDNLIIELNPMEIRTFIITYSEKSGDSYDDNNSNRNTATTFIILIVALIKML